MARIAGVETAADLLARTGAHAVLPVVPALAPLFPLGGPERGRLYGIHGDAGASLVNALVSCATQEGAWCALVDMPHVGLRAAHEHGVALQRVVCVDTDRSSPGSGSVWGRVVGALVEGIDIVVVRDPVCPPAEARRLAARVKAQGAVLLAHGDTSVLPVDAVLTARTRSWQFTACAVARTVEVSAEGRRIPGVRRTVVLLPSPAGGAEPAGT